MCAKTASYCTLKGLKAHLHAMSSGQIKSLARSCDISLKNKLGHLRTKKTLILTFLKRKKHSVARKLGIHLITSAQKREMRMSRGSSGRRSSGRRSSGGRRKSRRSSRRS